MKFDKVEPKEPWTVDKIEKQIETVWSEIKLFNQRMNDIESEKNVLNHEKSAIKIKIGNKRKYITQLENQMRELNPFPHKNKTNE